MAVKKEKYAVHPDFSILTHIRPSLNPKTLLLTQKTMRMLYYRERSDAAVRVERLTIPVTNGPDVSALLYTPKNTKTEGCLLDIHGGGYAFPAAPYHYALARKYAVQASCQVLFPDYRLAPGQPFPAAVQDCFAAYEWLLKHTASPIAVGRDSAGGTLSMAVTLMAIEEGMKVPCAQLLMYPSVGNCGETESMRLYTDTAMCNTRDMETYGQMYVHDPVAGKLYWRSPIEAESLAGTPPTYIETAEFDSLRDGALIYAEKLMELGIAAEVHQTKGTLHGYDMVLKSPIVQDMVRRRTDFLRTAFTGQ